MADSFAGGNHTFLRGDEAAAAYLNLRPFGAEVNLPTQKREPGTGYREREESGARVKRRST
jgi:hypothetical protein